MTVSNESAPPLGAASQSQPRFRIGAVARMAGMPVATLRIWEQRYQAVRPTKTTSGHRLFSSADAERATLLRQLTRQGQAISLLATLSTDRLREVIISVQGSKSAKVSRPTKRSGPMKILVVGQSLARRLQRWSDRSPNRPAFQFIGVFDSLESATHRAQDYSEPWIDVFLWQSPGLQPGVGKKLRLAQTAWRARVAAVTYRFSNTTGRAELEGVGAEALLEPANDETLGAWLESLGRSATHTGHDSGADDTSAAFEMALSHRLISAPRFAELELTEFADLPSAVSCECPGHLAQLLIQISNFETYSGDCVNRSPSDAKLHAFLQRTAGAARMLFETALERVAIAEGLPLPDRTQAISTLPPDE
ncbi:MAG: MerR family transcriptional regulator [Gammaproteobacteria bacterium]|nr:MerR family transcriptional regulator [Gammaproteobacteria bacterium]